MALTHSGEFKRDAVRIALSSGLTRRQVASDLGTGLSTLGKWIRAISDEAKVPERDADLLCENERLRKESRILREEREVPKKAGSVLRGSKAMEFQFIASYRGSLSCTHLCRMMGVTDRGLRAWRRRPPSKRQRRDMVILAHIRDQHRLSLGSYGRPRMTEELNELGLRVGQRRVDRLMRQNGIRVIRSRKFKRTTNSDHAFNIAPNPLQQDFVTSGPNQKWAGDITYVWSREGWVYLAVILDLFSRRVIGWAISNRMKQDLAIRALNMAVALRRPPPGCLHHTDRGAQYCAHDYQKILRRHGFRVSMSGKGNCYDNSAVESFFKSLKAELVWRRDWRTRRDVEIALFEYINGFYNPRRKHSALGWKSPVVFEQRAA
ncbi:IS3 family transposase [Paracoccus methylovorus]|uniref:IS3 family transposase n=1 Tax=Paracoccus methylovorus TaxID=2812658 RepID=A0ABX7JPB8_9RHOB|nr:MULTISPECIES: IS3 family transposase [Paracoccus]QRZ15801.1 IS3 family transposase [Paracoccus methylovorus]